MVHFGTCVGVTRSCGFFSRNAHLCPLGSDARRNSIQLLSAGLSGVTVPLWCVAAVLCECLPIPQTLETPGHSEEPRPPCCSFKLTLQPPCPAALGMLPQAPTCGKGRTCGQDALPTPEAGSSGPPPLRHGSPPSGVIHLLSNQGDPPRALVPRKRSQDNLGQSGEPESPPYL
jgi:hypothetical protein